MPDGRGYLTPDYDGNASLECLRLTLPSYLWRFVHGALGELTESSNWVQFGDLTPDDMVSLFTDALDNMRDCRMIGQVIAMLTDTLPYGCLWLNGETHSSDDYPTLYEYLPESMKDKGSFTLPVVSGKYLRGINQGNGIGDMGGQSQVTLGIQNIPEHTHTYTPPTLNIDIEGAGAPDLLAGGIGLPNQTGSTGGGEPFDILPPFMSVRWAIVAK